MVKTNSLVNCIVLSIIIHSLVFFIIFHKSKKQSIFMQVPFEVSFYSPVQSSPAEIIEQKEKSAPVEKKVEPKEKKKTVAKKRVKKDSIVVKKEKEDIKKQEEPVAGKIAEENKESSESKNSSSIVSSGKGIMLENKNFKYSYYTNTIVKKISKYWQWSNVSSEYRAVVYFKIARDGSVYDIKINETSSDTYFDQNTVRAVELASPFAPLPSSYEEDYLGVYFEFKFH